MEKVWNFTRFLFHSFSRRKSAESYKDLKTDLKRCLSTFDLTLLGIGSTIGAGIYILTGNVARNIAGPAIIVSFFIAAVATLLSGLALAEFGSRVPRTGNAYIYCYITLGELCGFIMGWFMLFNNIIGSATVMKALSEYINSVVNGRIKDGIIFLIGEIHIPYLAPYIDLFSISLTMFFTVIPLLGVKDSVRLNNFFVLTNVTTILLAIFVGFGYVDIGNWSDFAPYGAGGIMSGAATCFFTFIGFDVICNASEEAKNPATSIPISLTLAILICFLLYFGVSAVLTLMVPYSQMDESAAVAVAFKQRGVNFMGYLISMGAILGLSGNNLIGALAIPRQMYALALDGMIFKVFCKVQPDTNVPVVATLSGGVLMGIVVAILDLNALVEMLSIGSLLQYTAVNVCLIVIRYRYNESSSSVNTTDDGNSLIRNPSQGFIRTSALYMLVLATIVILFTISYVLQQHHGLSSLVDNNTTMVVVCLLVFSILLICTFLSCFCKQCDESVYFKVPLVPWVPVLAIFFNTYLMVSISAQSWIRTAVWFCIGILVYFGYSMHHTEREASHQ